MSVFLMVLGDPGEGVVQTLKGVVTRRLRTAAVKKILKETTGSQQQN